MFGPPDSRAAPKAEACDEISDFTSSGIELEDGPRDAKKAAVSAAASAAVDGKVIKGVGDEELTGNCKSRDAPCSFSGG